MKFKTELGHSEPKFQPYQRDENLVRPWALPGTPGLEHRIGGLEKENITGNVSYDPENHQLMVKIRQDEHSAGEHGLRCGLRQVILPRLF